MAEFNFPPRCAVCLAGRCQHEVNECPNSLAARTTVAGTACCTDCASLLLDLQYPSPPRWPS
jgi:hypothetical protein